MPIVTAETHRNGNLTGADHGATVSLIFDHSDPEADHDFTATRTTRPGSSRRASSPSRPGMSACTPPRATS